MLPLLQSLPAAGGNEKNDATNADTDEQHNDAFLADGVRTVVFAWGDDASYQLGYLTGSSRRSTQPRPCQLPPRVAVVQVVAGVQHSAAVASDGRLFTWGSGHLGSGRGSWWEPRPVEGFGPNLPVLNAAAAYHTLAATPSAVYGWGPCANGELGQVSGEEVASPLKIIVASSALVASGTNFSFVASNGKLWGFGLNESGQLGTADRERFVIHDRRVTALAAGDVNSVAIGVGGALWICGGLPNKHDVSERGKWCEFTRIRFAAREAVAEEGWSSTQQSDVSIASAYVGKEGLAVTADGDLYTFSLDTRPCTATPCCSDVRRACGELRLSADGSLRIQDSQPMLEQVAEVACGQRHYLSLVQTKLPARPALEAPYCELTDSRKGQVPSLESLCVASLCRSDTVGPHNVHELLDLGLEFGLQRMVDYACEYCVLNRALLTTNYAGP